MPECPPRGTPAQRGAPSGRLRAGGAGRSLDLGLGRAGGDGRTEDAPHLDPLRVVRAAHVDAQVADARPERQEVIARLAGGHGVAAVGLTHELGDPGEPGLAKHLDRGHERPVAAGEGRVEGGAGLVDGVPGGPDHGVVAPVLDGLAVGAGGEHPLPDRRDEVHVLPVRAEVRPELLDLLDQLGPLGVELVELALQGLRDGRLGLARAEPLQLLVLLVPALVEGVDLRLLGVDDRFGRVRGQLEVLERRLRGRGRLLDHAVVGGERGQEGEHDPGEVDVRLGGVGLGHGVTRGGREGPGIFFAQ